MSGGLSKPWLPWQHPLHRATCVEEFLRVASTLARCKLKSYAKPEKVPINAVERPELECAHDEDAEAGRVPQKAAI